MGWTGMRRAIFFLGWFGGGVFAGPVLHADPITSWNGGSTSVESLGQTSSEQGSHSESAVRGSTTFSYASVYDPFPGAYKVDAGGTADARVNGTADNLLQVNATYSVGNPGTSPYDYQSPVPAQSIAQASWDGDRIHIGPDANGVIPDSIRLGVGMDLSPVWGYTRTLFDSPRGGTLDVQIGNQHIQLNDQSTWGDPAYHSSDISAWFVKQGFASAQNVVNSSNPWSTPIYHVMAYLNLPVDANGWTSAFDLGLKSTMDGGFPQSNSSIDMAPGTFSLSLDDITLPDGTSVVDAGHVVTFESGLAWATPVPEPGSLALAASMVLGAIGLRKRLFRD
ncbi:hypothetical protein [Singulisphaera sp. PoT]|uniref:hypothetical protein n=1 Tax=Singulisphaera sp. PoT TaxID=3411797 RepID=UPI003BF5CAE5